MPVAIAAVELPCDARVSLAGIAEPVLPVWSGLVIVEFALLVTLSAEDEATPVPVGPTAVALLNEGKPELAALVGSATVVLLEMLTSGLTPVARAPAVVFAAMAAPCTCVADVS